MYATNCALKLRYVLEAAKVRLDAEFLFNAMELSKIIKSKVVRLPAAIESWKASFFKLYVTFVHMPAGAKA